MKKIKIFIALHHIICSLLQWRKFSLNKETLNKKKRKTQLKLTRESVVLPNSLRILGIQNFNHPTVSVRQQREIKYKEDSPDNSLDLNTNIDDFLIPKTIQSTKAKDMKTYDSVGMNINLVTREFIKNKNERIKTRTAMSLLTFGKQSRKKKTSKQIEMNSENEILNMNVFDTNLVNKFPIQFTQNSNTSRPGTCLTSRLTKSSRFKDSIRSIQQSYFKRKDSISIGNINKPLFTKPIKKLKNESGSVISIPLSQKKIFTGLSQP